jgi:hypothetical protein
MKKLTKLLLICFLFLTACQDNTPSPLVGDWIDLGTDTVAITFQEDGTLLSSDRPLLNGVQYDQPNDDTLTYTFPNGDSFEFALTLTPQQMTLRNLDNSQITIYERVTPIEDLSEFIVGRWQRDNAPEALVDFNEDGSMLLIGFLGLGNGSYEVIDNQNMELHFEEQVTSQPVTVFFVNDTLILRNDIDQIISLVRFE